MITQIPAPEVTKAEGVLIMTVYEIFYDYDNEFCTDRNCREMFEGEWGELQEYIKTMRTCGCYNIRANAVSEEY